MLVCPCRVCGTLLSSLLYLGYPGRASHGRCWRLLFLFMDNILVQHGKMPGNNGQADWTRTHPCGAAHGRDAQSRRRPPSGTSDASRTVARSELHAAADGADLDGAASLEVPAIRVARDRTAHSSQLCRVQPQPDPAGSTIAGAPGPADEPMDVYGTGTVVRAVRTVRLYERCVQSSHICRTCFNVNVPRPSSLGAFAAPSASTATQADPRRRATRTRGRTRRRRQV